MKARSAAGPLQVVVGDLPETAPSGGSDRLVFHPRESPMPEQRARKYHRDRVAGTLRDEITAMIEGELSDPRIAFAYVSQVALNPGGKSALIYISVDGGEKEEQETLAALMDARGYIRHELLERTGKRHVPDLSFHIDRSEKMKARIEDLMGRSRKRKKAGEATGVTAPETPAPPAK